MLHGADWSRLASTAGRKATIEMFAMIESGSISDSAGPLATAGLVALLGLVLGSYAGLLAYRLPRGAPTVLARSRCPACGTVLTARDLIPLLSWLLARGRCRHCGAAVPARYPAIEGATAALLLLAWAAAGTGTAGLLLGLLAVALVVAAAADLEAMIIPDAAVLAVAALGLARRGLLAGGWPDGLTGLVLLGAVGLAARTGFRAWKGVDGLGLGDVKLLAAGGLWLGIAAVPALLVTAGGLGILSGLAWRAAGRGPRFPFGPAIAAALYLLAVADAAGVALP